MNCPNCGNPVNPGVKFCPRCGKPLQLASPQPPVQQPPVQQPPVQQPTQPVGYQPQPNGYPQPPQKQNGKGLAIAAMVCGIVGIVLVWFSGIVGLILGVCGIVFGALGMKRCPSGYPGHGMAVTGLVLGIITAVLSIPVLICIGSLCAAGNALSSGMY